MKKLSPGEEKILEKLDIIIHILSLQVGIDKSITERSRLLKLAGVDNKTLAKIFNTSEATIRTLISRLRRK